MTRTDLNALSDAGTGKSRDARTVPARYLTRAILAGIFIAVGTLLSNLCAAWFYVDAPAVAKLLSSVTFSAALILIVLLGGELFTGANLVMGVSLYDGAVSLGGVLRVWAICYVGNFIGCFLFALIFVGSGASRDLLAAYLAICVPGKLSAPWYSIMLKGVLCNFLVCLGVFSGFHLKSEGGKIFVITAVITTFVMAGFEHSIANMALFSLQTMLNGTGELAAMTWNLLWATVGNLLGGAVLLGLPLWYAGSSDPRE